MDFGKNYFRDPLPKKGRSDGSVWGHSNSFQLLGLCRLDVLNKSPSPQRGDPKKVPPICLTSGCWDWGGPIGAVDNHRKNIFWAEEAHKDRIAMLRSSLLATHGNH